MTMILREFSLRMIFDYKIVTETAAAFGNGFKKKRQRRSQAMRVQDPKNQEGFTLFELVVVLTVMLILAAFTSSATLHSRERARLSRLYDDIRLVKSAAQMFKQDMGFYPFDACKGVDPGMAEKYGWKSGCHSGVWETADANGLLNDWNGPYLKKWMNNPWGGKYDWENFPPGFNQGGIVGGAVFLGIKPLRGGGGSGMPTAKYEEILQRSGVDESPLPSYVIIKMGSYPS
jgi:prepilin-type N-terminal cleavage/methylation domain-containing protein